MNKPNDNMPKEQEKEHGEVLSEPGSIKKEHGERIVIVDFNLCSPNNSDSLIVAEELEIEGREEQLLKQSLGI